MKRIPITVLLLAAAFLASLDSTLVRHASVLGMSECSVRQWLSVPDRLDVAAFGSSRVRAGLSPDAIAQASAGALRSNVNFGRSGLSAMRSYVMLRDLVERGARPRFVFLEVDLEALQTSEPHAAIRPGAQAAFLRYADLASVLEIDGGLGPVGKARLLALTTLDKVRESIIPVLRGAALLDAVRPVDQPVRTCLLANEFALGERGSRELAAQREAMLALHHDRERSYAPGHPRAFQRAQELYYLARIRELLATHGAGLVVARHGAAYEPPLSPAAVAAVRVDVPEFAQPPASLVRATWPTFLDASHLGPDGRAAYSAWLARRLLAPAGR